VRVAGALCPTAGLWEVEDGRKTGAPPAERICLSCARHDGAYRVLVLLLRTGPRIVETSSLSSGASGYSDAGAQREMACTVGGSLHY